MIYYLLFILIITIIFVYHVETSIGNILLRYNSSSKITINISSLLNFMIHPLHNTFLWNVDLIDVNYIFYLLISTSIYLCLI